MFRNLILLIAIGIVVWLLSRMIKNKTQQKNPLQKKTKHNDIKNIVQCHVCQVFIPEDKAIQHGQHSFCSKKHLDEWNENH